MEKNKIIADAQAGDLSAIEKVADAYYYGTDEFEQNGKYAFYWFNRGVESDGNNAFCLNGLGRCYASGRGTDADTDMAIKFFTRSAEIGYVPAQYNLADELEKKKDPKCIDWYEKALQGGDYEAGYKLFEVLYNDELVPKDLDKSVKYLRISAENGYVDAMYILGLIYINGEGVNASLETAAVWMDRAAKGGNAHAMLRLALMYREGDGVAADKVEYIKWFLEAAKHGESNALKNLAIACSEVFGVEFGKEKYFETVKTGADEGYYECMVYTGDCYREGYGVEADIDKAEEYYKTAADDKYPLACWRYGVYLLANKPEETEEMIKMLEIAAQNGNDRANMVLGECYANGSYGVEKNIEKAIRYYAEGARLGDTDAYVRLGLIYEGLNQMPRAEEMYDLGVKAGNTDAMACRAILYLNTNNITEIAKAIPILEDICIADASDKTKNYDYAKGTLRTLYTERALKNSINFEKAYQIFLPDTDAGDAEAMYIVAEALGELADYHGRNGDTSKHLEEYDESRSWMQKSAEAGYADAQADIGISYMIHDDVENAAKWLERAAKQGNPIGLLHMGNYYYDGNSVVEKNPDKAFEYYSKVAETGNLDAIGKMGKCYAAGIGTKQDYNKALEYLKKATSGNTLYHNDYLWTMGWIYCRKECRNMDEAIRCLKPFLDRKDADAEYLIGLTYGDMGIYDHAEYWLTQALEGGREEAGQMLNNLHEIQKSEASSNNRQSSGQSSKGGCYIATAVYGSYDCPQVWTLRRFRDLYLSQYVIGRIFIRCYYTVSPLLVKYFGSTAWFRKFWKGQLDRIVYKLRKEGYESTPYQD